MGSPRSLEDTKKHEVLCATSWLGDIVAELHEASMSKNFLFALIIVSLASPLAIAQTKQSVTSGKRYPRIVIRNATVVDGNGTPAAGPKDIVIEGNRISDVVGIDPVALRSGRSRRTPGDVEIDATGKYVLPGLIDAHAHLQDERAGVPQPFDYELKLWLACGITTVRDVGSDTTKAL